MRVVQGRLRSAQERTRYGFRTEVLARDGKDGQSARAEHAQRALLDEHWRALGERERRLLEILSALRDGLRVGGPEDELTRLLDPRSQTEPG